MGEVYLEPEDYEGQLEQLHELLEQRDARIRELEARVRVLEAQVRRLRESDGPLHGPEPPPRWPCPKCGKGTWEIFGHHRACNDRTCDGGIDTDDWSWEDLLEVATMGEVYEGEVEVEECDCELDGEGCTCGASEVPWGGCLCSCVPTCVHCGRDMSEDLEDWGE